MLPRLLIPSSFAARRILTRNKAEPCREISPPAECSAVADGGNDTEFDEFSGKCKAYACGAPRNENGAVSLIDLLS
jgi:hypothetical protein